MLDDPLALFSGPLWIREDHQSEPRKRSADVFSGSGQKLTDCGVKRGVGAAYCGSGEGRIRHGLTSVCV
jgi:hypothetical protein